MNKYLDAEKLIAEIQRFSATEYGGITLEDDVANSALDYVLEKIIPSLQQEQQEVDLVAELKHHLATTPKEQLEKEWKELEPWGNIGPTVQEFLYGKQPEVELEEEISESFFSHNFEDDHGDLSIELSMEDFSDIARHFAEWGAIHLNARKEK